jgi:site-specific recombinase XerD
MTSGSMPLTMKHLIRHFSSKALPELQAAAEAVLARLTSDCSKRSYRSAIKHFVRWYCASPKLAFDRRTVVSYVAELEERRLAPSTIGVRLAAIRALASECCELGLVGAEAVAGIARVAGAKRLGTRVGNWLSAEQSRRLLESPNQQSSRGLRDRAMLAMMLGCGFRRRELVSLDVSHLRSREGRWLVVNLIGKGGRMRTVPVPAWVMTRVNQWNQKAQITSGALFRPITKMGVILSRHLCDRSVWNVVHEHSGREGLLSIAPHDLRRTCAHLCFRSGGALEQIQFLLGHASSQTTERYLGCRQELVSAVNDSMPLAFRTRLTAS